MRFFKASKAGSPLRILKRFSIQTISNIPTVTIQKTGIIKGLEKFRIFHLGVFQLALFVCRFVGICKRSS